MTMHTRRLRPCPTLGSAYSVMVGIPSSASRRVSRSIIARPRPLRCQAGATATSQIVAVNTPSLRCTHMSGGAMGRLGGHAWAPLNTPRVLP